jgi:hypothetical protein
MTSLGVCSCFEHFSATYLTIELRFCNTARIQEPKLWEAKRLNHHHSRPRADGN